MLDASTVSRIGFDGQATKEKSRNDGGYKVEGALSAVGDAMTGSGKETVAS